MLAFYTSLRNRVRPYAPAYFLGLIIIAQAMRRSHGSLKSNHLIFISLLTLFILFDQFKNSKMNEGAKFLCVLIFLIMGIEKFEIIYSTSEGWAWFYRAGLALVLGLCFALKYFKDKKILKILIYGVIGVLFASVPLASPAPAVDVWVYFEKAVSALTNFINPYELTYPDIYQGAHHYNPKFIYWPFSLYLLTPLGFLVDVRFTLALSLLVSAYLIAREKFYSTWDILIFLLFPINFFVVEQAWIEPLMIPFLILHFKYLREDRPVGSALALGAMCAIKQFMLFPFLLSSLYLLFRRGFKYTLVAPALILTSFLPFLIASPDTFIQNTFLEFLHFPARADSMSWVAHFLYHSNYELSGVFTGFLYLGAFIYCALLLYRRQSLEVLKWGYFITLAITFLFGKQSFANYYFLLFVIYFLALKRNSDIDPKF